MLLNKIQLENFRIFNTLEITFHPKINIIFGANGQGKTSILEAIYFLSVTKSFKAKADIYALNHKADFFNIKGQFCNSKEMFKNDFRVYFSRSEGKYVFINNEKVKTFSEVVGMYPVILLSLEDIELTFGAPASRRKFLDILLSQLYPSYLFALQKYKQSVLQKNKLLSLDNYQNKKEEIAIWNKQLVSFASEILFYRINFIHFLNENISEYYRRISGKKEKVSILYRSTINSLEPEISLEKIKSNCIEALQNIKESEIKRQSCIIGPHRDDVEFFKDDFPFKSHGSQGENKSFLIALKLLESQYIFEISKKRPFLLLDDIFGELDAYRVENLLINILDKGQTFITTTDDKKINKIVSDRTSFFEVENSMIKQ